MLERKIRVEVKYMGFPLKDENIRIKRNTLMDLIRELCDEHGRSFRNLFFDRKTGKVLPQVWVVVNDKYTSFPEGLRKELKDGDKVVISLPIAGG